MERHLRLISLQPPFYFLYTFDREHQHNLHRSYQYNQLKKEIAIGLIMESRKIHQSREACKSVSLIVLLILHPTISNSHSISYCQAHSSPLIGDGSSRVLRLLLILCSRSMAKRKRLYLRLSLQSA